jgi:hypothetical protein
MSNKKKFIRNMQRAKSAHMRWVSSIKLLVSDIDIDIDEKEITLDAVNSEFGLWYYNEAVLFSSESTRFILEQIEELLLELHDKYMKIYPIYYGTRKRSFLGKLLGGKTPINTHESKFAQQFYEEIVQLSNKLKLKLRAFETLLVNLSEDKFNELSCFTQQKENLKPIGVKSEEVSDDDDNGAYYFGARGR